MNDALGHSSGDEVLEIVARRLTAAVRAGDTVARWGGDEFVVLCPSVTDADEATRVADRIRHALAIPFRISAGVAIDRGQRRCRGRSTGTQSPEALARRCRREGLRSEDRGRRPGRARSETGSAHPLGRVLQEVAADREAAVERVARDLLAVSHAHE